MGQSWYFWAAVAAVTVLFALIDLDVVSEKRTGRVHTLSLIAYFTSFVVCALVFFGYQPAHKPYVWLFPAAIRVAVVAILLGSGSLFIAAETGESLVHRDSDEPHDMTMKEMRETLTPDQLAVEEEYERRLREQEKR
jgi:hypothetical protein